MDDDQKTPVKQEMNESSSSSSPDMQEWELFDSDIVTSKRGILLNDSTENEPGPNPSPSGLFMHTSPIRHSGVEELVTDHDRLGHNESNSSSDIDVIDECLEESNSNLSLPSMEISFSTSEISNTLTASERENPTEPLIHSESQTVDTQTLPEPAPVHHRIFSAFEYVMGVLRLIIDAVNAFHGDRMSAKDYFVIGFVVSLCMIVPCTHIALHKASWQEAKLEQMEGHVNKLLTENEHLKSRVLEKIESGKIFGDLDEEVKDLKTENKALHIAMQTVIEQLEEQTHAIKRGLELKENMHKDPYKREISKLKEQINLLRIDNEELQKQLVRIRYGKHASHQENSGTKTENEERKFKYHHETPGKENSFEDMKERREEIRELRKKLNDEVAKLKNWKESLEEFVSEIEKPHGSEGSPKNERDEEKKSFKHEKEDEKHNHKRHKNRKFYNWSWKEIKKNFKGTIENFPGMISKYVIIDKQKVDGVLDTISHYYKKAQDKTKKILESYSVDEKTQNVKNEIWTLMGEMKNKWIDMKNEFLETHFGENDADENKAEDLTTVHSEVPDPFEKDLKFSSEVKQEPSDVTPNSGKEAESSAEEIQAEESETKGNVFKRIYDNIISKSDPEKIKEWEESMQSVKEVNKLLKEAQRRFSQQNSNINTWMFERAQHRAELRENADAEEEGYLNWYLRKSNKLKDSDSSSTSDLEETYESDFSEQRKRG